MPTKIENLPRVSGQNKNIGLVFTDKKINTRKKVFPIGGWMSFYLFEDYPLWAKIFLTGSSYYNFQEPLLHFRTNPVT